MWWGSLPLNSIEKTPKTLQLEAKRRFSPKTQGFGKVIPSSSFPEGISSEYLKLTPRIWKGFCCFFQFVRNRGHKFCSWCPIECRILTWLVVIVMETNKSERNFWPYYFFSIFLMQFFAFLAKMRFYQILRSSRPFLTLGAGSSLPQKSGSFPITQHLLSCSVCALLINTMACKPGSWGFFVWWFSLWK